MDVLVELTTRDVLVDQRVGDTRRCFLCRDGVTLVGALTRTIAAAAARGRTTRPTGGFSLPALGPATRRRRSTTVTATSIGTAAAAFGGRRTS